MRGVTKRRFPKMLRVIFQPALPMRGVTSPSSDDRATVSFQPALPMRGVTMTKLTRGFTFLFQPALPMRGVTAGDDGRCVTGHISTRTPHAGSDCKYYCANLLLRSTYSVIRQTRYTQQARQASLCHTIWCEPHVCHMRASCSHHGPTTPRTLQLRTLVSHLHAQSSSHICFQDCRIANYLSPDRSARRARS